MFLYINIPYKTQTNKKEKKPTLFIQCSYIKIRISFVLRLCLAAALNSSEQTLACSVNKTSTKTNSQILAFNFVNTEHKSLPNMY